MFQKRCVSPEKCWFLWPESRSRCGVVRSRTAKKMYFPSKNGDFCARTWTVQSAVVIRLLLPISSTGDGCCSCQNLRTVSFPEVCKVFWVQPIELRCGVAVTASRSQRKLLVRPLSQNVSTTQHGVRAAMLRIGPHRSLQCGPAPKPKPKAKVKQGSLEKKATQWVQSSWLWTCCGVARTVPISGSECVVKSGFAGKGLPCVATAVIFGLISRSWRCKSLGFAVSQSSRWKVSMNVVCSFRCGWLLPSYCSWSLHAFLPLLWLCNSCRPCKVRGVN